MDESKFHTFLTERDVVIVHFSHFAVMGQYVEFPDDLKHAITFYQSETRSCCALWPGHKMELPGSVGVIFRPTLNKFYLSWQTTLDHLTLDAQKIQVVTHLPNRPFWKASMFLQGATMSGESRAQSHLVSS